MSLFGLKFRMWFLVTALFRSLYGIISAVAAGMGIGNFWFYLAMSLVMLFIQYMIGPKIIEWSMRVKYVGKSEYPKLYKIVEGLARSARIPMPRVALADIGIPNAFAFGRWSSDGRVCE